MIHRRNNKLRLAVIGAGHLGRIHARLLAERNDVQLVGLTDPSAESRRQAAAALADSAAANVEVLEDYTPIADQIDAAIVAAPTTYHHRIVLDLLNRGIHVLVEKPVASHLWQADEMIDAARQRGAILQVGHVERFNPILAAVEPHLAEPKYIEAVRVGPYSFRSTDIGVVLDLMIHDIDLVLSMVRGPVRSVEALGCSVLGGHEDLASAHVTFESGCVAHFSVSRVSPASRREMRLFSPRGFVGIDFAARTASVIRPSGGLIDRQLDVEALTAEQRDVLKQYFFRNLLPAHNVTAPSGNALADEQGDFVDSIRRGRPPLVSGEDGRAALAVADQVLQAIDRHLWDGTREGRVGPLAVPAAAILQTPPTEPDIRRAG